MFYSKSTLLYKIRLSKRELSGLKPKGDITISADVDD